VAPFLEQFVPSFAAALCRHAWGVPEFATRYLGNELFRVTALSLLHSAKFVGCERESLEPGVRILTTAMETHDGDYEAMYQCMWVLFDWAAHCSNCVALLEAVPASILVHQRYPCSMEMCDRLVAFLSTLARHPCTTSAVVEHIPLVLTAVRLYWDNLSVSTHAALFFSGVSRNMHSDERAQEIVAELEEALQAHHTDAVLVGACVQALSRFAYRDKNLELLVTKAALVARVLGEHGQHLNVASTGVKFLMDVSSTQEHLPRMLEFAPLVKRLAAMHLADGEMLSRCAWMFRNVSCFPEGCATLLGHVETLAAWMGRHPERLDVVNPVTTCAARLCGKEGENAVRLATLLEPMVACTQRHAEDPEVASNCVWYLRRLAFREENHAALASVMPTLRPVMEGAGPMQDPVLQELYQALCALVSPSP
jgi:hypothetical protein